MYNITPLNNVVSAGKMVVRGDDDGIAVTLALVAAAALEEERG